MSTHCLDAWASGRRMGTLVYYDDTGRFAFEYAPEWAAFRSALGKMDEKAQFTWSK